METAGYLLTGSTGFLGKLVLECLIRRREELGAERVFLLIRPRGGASARERFREIARAACFAHLPDGWSERVTVVEGDLAEPGCGLPPDAAAELRREVTHVLHAAASVDFDLPLADATAANVSATLEALELARACEALRVFVSVSTAYVTPHPGDGLPIDEALAPLPAPASELYQAIRDRRAPERDLLERSGHPNTYTFTKSLAEHLLLERRGDVPLVIVRPSIISATWARPFPGWIDSAAAFAAFVALIGSGHLRAVVGDPRTRLNLVPADWVAAEVIEAAAAPLDGAAIRHAVAARAHSPRIAECREAILEFFGRHPAGRRAAVPYLGPRGLRFRLADGLHNQAPVRLAMLRSARERRRARRLLDQLDAINRIFPYFTERSFAFRAERPFDDPRFDLRAYLSVVCEGVARHLLRKPVPSGAAAAAASPVPA